MRRAGLQMLHCRIFDIQHFCTHDGPGVRTTVFFKGCPLHCTWCHNPESQAAAPQVMFHASKCIGCNSCGGDRRSHPELCPTGAMELVGKAVSVDEIVAEVLKDESYYRHSGGGMTLSGGEPLAQPAQALSILSSIHGHGIHAAVETSGTCPEESYVSILPHADLFLWDVKLMNEELYSKHTGGSLDVMLSNLERVASEAKDLIFRVLYIPEIHSDPAIAESTRSLLHRYPQFGHEVIPYHPFGNAKRKKLGLPEEHFREPEPEEIERFSAFLR